MAVVCGFNHTIALSDDGVVYGFGQNDCGQLGLGIGNIDVIGLHLMHHNCVSLPNRIPNLPKINQVSCGWNFTVCVDEEGFIWSFGKNKCGAQGTGSTKNFDVPQKIQNIPPVLSIDCGYDHSIIITNDLNMWSCGHNRLGQLCLGTTEEHSTFQQTPFSNISKISVGGYYTFFQNNKGEIFSCGFNESGELGLGHFNHPQIAPSLIPNLPSNIVHTNCGGYHNLFLDSDGNVFSVGNNLHGQLGLGHYTNQNELNQIPNIPPIRSISCVGFISYLIDFEGNLWSFGLNSNGQLGHGDTVKRNIPTKIENLKNIHQISNGSTGSHFFAKDSKSTIFVMGPNYSGQLGIENLDFTLIPKEIDTKFFSIWGSSFNSTSKSARK